MRVHVLAYDCFPVSSLGFSVKLRLYKSRNSSASLSKMEIHTTAKFNPSDINTLLQVYQKKSRGRRNNSPKPGRKDWLNGLAIYSDLDSDPEELSVEDQKFRRIRRRELDRDWLGEKCNWPQRNWDQEQDQDQYQQRHQRHQHQHQQHQQKRQRRHKQRDHHSVNEKQQFNPETTTQITQAKETKGTKELKPWKPRPQPSSIFCSIQTSITTTIKTSLKTSLKKSITRYLRLKIQNFLTLPFQHVTTTAASKTEL